MRGVVLQLLFPAVAPVDAVPAVARPDAEAVRRRRWTFIDGAARLRGRRLLLFLCSALPDVVGHGVAVSNHIPTHLLQLRIIRAPGEGLVCDGLELLAGGGLFETGAGGSAPKHVQQFVKEGHLRWDSLGEYLALAVSLEDHAAKTGNERAKLLAETLNEATGKLLDNNKSPLRKVKQLDNRGSTFYIAKYWAEAMAKHDDAFTEMAGALAANEDKIVAELIECQGTPVDIGGYWKPDPKKVEAAMRASPTFNAILGN